MYITELREKKEKKVYINCVCKKKTVHDMFIYETTRPAQKLVLPVDDGILGILRSGGRSMHIMQFRNPIAAVLEHSLKTHVSFTLEENDRNKQNKSTLFYTGSKQ